MVFAIILKLSPSPKPQLDQPAHGSLAANIHAFGRRFKLASINSRADADLGLGVAHSNNDCADDARQHQTGHSPGVAGNQPTDKADPNCHRKNYQCASADPDHCHQPYEDYNNADNNQNRYFHRSPLDLGRTLQCGLE
jgi:hypothetical protein